MWVGHWMTIARLLCACDVALSAHQKLQEFGWSTCNIWICQMNLLLRFCRMSSYLILFELRFLQLLNLTADSLLDATTFLKSLTKWPVRLVRVMQRIVKRVCSLAHILPIDGKNGQRKYKMQQHAKKVRRVIQNGLQNFKTCFDCVWITHHIASFSESFQYPWQAAITMAEIVCILCWPGNSSRVVR